MVNVKIIVLVMWKKSCGYEY